MRAGSIRHIVSPKHSQSPVFLGVVNNPSSISLALTNAIWNGDAAVGLGESSNTFYTPPTSIGLLGSTGFLPDNPSDTNSPANLVDQFTEGDYYDENDD